MQNAVFKTLLIAGLMLIAMALIRGRLSRTSPTQTPDELAIVAEASQPMSETIPDQLVPTAAEELMTNAIAVPPVVKFSETNSTPSQSVVWERSRSNDLTILSTETESATSETNTSIQLPQFWTNSLGMVFVLVPEAKLLFSMYDVRVQDYQAFVTATRRGWRPLPLEQGPLHPAVNVSWYDAKAFCEWLADRERQGLQHIASAALSYRLPTEEEWGIAAGFTAGENALFPWGDSWPPPWGAGNFSQKLKVDGYPHTSPVGVFAPNKYGLYDMWGNVMQWCEYNPGRRVDRPLRGASWATVEPFALRCSFITHSQPNVADPDLGFRLVLAAPSQ